MRTFIQHHGRTLAVDFDFNEKRNAVIWYLAVEPGLDIVPLIGLITVLAADVESAEELVKWSALGGIAWQEDRSREDDSLGQLVGYPVAIEPSLPWCASPALSA
ncbi:hypothetical protein P5Y53_19215 [Dyella jiangningensis]|uniref:hypothetical protein n=1 Tax=Dyella jiangningensis TaxID=1379159 RepID=UPI0024105EF5|nr:hypothetical protein [Dyella jiangningensis]MDG2539818.1 hypothetical protein [Dyella jiangningensis]